MRTTPNRCWHRPRCPAAAASDALAAVVIASHPEQGWSLLCNGVITFEDTGAIAPSGRLIPPQRPIRATCAGDPSRGCTAPRQVAVFVRRDQRLEGFDTH
jgi:hypothetical protein